MIISVKYKSKFEIRVLKFLLLFLFILRNFPYLFCMCLFDYFMLYCLNEKDLPTIFGVTIYQI